jgi:hypothetical protein
MDFSGSAVRQFSGLAEAIRIVRFTIAWSWPICRI